jgi:carbon monoxide dehydrogenase subunit G
MDIEKTISLHAGAQRVWEMLLDPKVMGECVPGMQSIEVISDTEYNASIHVKLAFISAKFKVKTLITEQTPPTYLRSESTGEDASVASSLKSVTELFLSEQGPELTELRVKVKVDLLGRLGSLGLSAMKTKADRMWEEFGRNLELQLNPPPKEASVPGAREEDAASSSPVIAGATAAAPERFPVPPVAATRAGEARWWRRLVGSGGANNIQIDIRRGDTHISIAWPETSAKECAAWLHDYVKQI